MVFGGTGEGGGFEVGRCLAGGPSRDVEFKGVSGLATHTVSKPGPAFLQGSCRYPDAGKAVCGAGRSTNRREQQRSPNRFTTRAGLVQQQQPGLRQRPPMAASTKPGATSWEPPARAMLTAMASEASQRNAEGCLCSRPRSRRDSPRSSGTSGLAARRSAAAAAAEAASPAALAAALWSPASSLPALAAMRSSPGGFGTPGSLAASTSSPSARCCLPDADDAARRRRCQRCTAPAAQEKASIAARKASASSDTRKSSRRAGIGGTAFVCREHRRATPGYWILLCVRQAARGSQSRTLL